MEIIKTEYSLKKNEIVTGLILSQWLKSKTKKNIIFTAITAILIITFLQQYFFPVSIKPDYYLGSILIIGCLILIAMIWIMPYVDRNKAVEAALLNNSFKLTVLSDKMILEDGREHKAEIPFDNSLFYKNGKSLFIIFTSKSEYILIPHRVVENKFEEVETLISNGLNNRNQEET